MKNPDEVTEALCARIAALEAELKEAAKTRKHDVMVLEAQIAGYINLLARKNAALAVFADKENWRVGGQVWAGRYEKICPIAFAARERDATEAEGRS